MLNYFKNKPFKFIFAYNVIFIIFLLYMFISYDINERVSIVDYSNCNKMSENQYQDMQRQIDDCHKTANGNYNDCLAVRDRNRQLEAWYYQYTNSNTDNNKKSNFTSGFATLGRNAFLETIFYSIPILIIGIFIPRLIYDKVIMK